MTDRYRVRCTCSRKTCPYREPRNHHRKEPAVNRKPMSPLSTWAILNLTAASLIWACVVGVWTGWYPVPDWFVMTVVALFWAGQVMFIMRALFRAADRVRAVRREVRRDDPCQCGGAGRCDGTCHLI